jgi:hypothetical protein
MPAEHLEADPPDGPHGQWRPSHEDSSGLRSGRTLAWISEHRRCVRDYETWPQHAEAMVCLAMNTTMPRRLAR